MPQVSSTKKLRVAGLVFLVAAVVLGGAGCTRDLEPRRAVGASPAGTNGAAVDRFDSPRETLELTRAAEIGALAIKGRVEARDGTDVPTPGDGRIVDVKFSSGDAVRAGQTVATFIPILSRAEELQRQILELDVELGVERGVSDDDLAELDAAVDRFDAERADLAIPIVAPVSGVVHGVSSDLTFPVDADETVFTVLTGSDLIAVVRTTAATVVDFEPGDQVRLVPFAIAASAATATISSIEPIEVDVGSPPVVEIRIEASDAASAATMTEALDQPGAAIDVEFAIDPGLRTWLPREVLHRQDGRSFLLVERPDGSLQRVTPRLGRRTSSHIEVLDATAGSNANPGSTLLGPGTVLVLR